MDFDINLTPAKTTYRTREQLYALCVLMCWADGLTFSNAVEDANSVTLIGRNKGNTGLSAYLLETNPNVTDVTFDDVPSLPFSTIFFKMLGVPLEVEFDEDGVGLVRFRQCPEAV